MNFIIIVITILDSVYDLMYNDFMYNDFCAAIPYYFVYMSGNNYFYFFIAREASITFVLRQLPIKYFYTDIKSSLGNVRSFLGI